MVLMGDNTTAVAYIKKWWYCFLGDVQSGTGDSHLGRAVCDLPHCMVHSREEDP